MQPAPRWLLTAAVSTLCLVRGVLGAFTEPDPAGFGIDRSRVTLTDKQRASMATALARCCGDVSKGDLSKSEADGARLQAKLLGLALLVDPDNAAALANLQRLKRQQPLPVDPAWPAAGVAKSLMSVAGTLTGAPGSGNAKLAGYCYALASELDPANDAVMATFARFSKSHGEPDWTAVLPSGDAPPPGVAPAQVDSNRVVIAQGETIAECRGFARNQAQVSGLVVLDVLGRPSGRPLDILGTILPYHVNTETRFELATFVGQQMNISFEEALSLVRTRHLSLQGGKKVRVSFADKYTPKDGGSAGLAFTLLFVSLLDGIQLDPDLAMTGDVTVDWKIRDVGAVAAKIIGAKESGKKHVLIPAGNRSAVEDMLLLEGPAALAGVQVFTAGTVAEAVEICRVDRLPALQQAMEQFTRFQTLAASRDVAALLREPAVQSALTSIADKAPNHLSADLLSRLAKGWKPAALSREASLTEALTILYPFEREVRYDFVMRDASRDGQVVDGKLRSEKLRDACCPEVRPLAEAITAFFAASVDQCLAQSKDGRFADLLRKRGVRTMPTAASLLKTGKPGQEPAAIRAASQQVRAELERLSVNRSFIEALTR